MERPLILFLLLVPLCVLASIYKWTDAQGNVHYSDQARNGAETVKVVNPQTYHNPTADKAGGQRNSSAVINEDSEYELIEISQPIEDSTIRNNQGQVIVHVTLMPQLSSEHRVQILIDGNALGEPKSSTSFTINNLDRGTHELTAKVIDATGETILESESVSFHMRRTYIRKS